MNRTEKALGKFNEGYNCAQSVAFAFADKMGISGDLALKSANGFGTGMGRKQEVCGAISGGILVLGHLHGRGENEEKPKQEILYAKVRDLIDGFKSKHSEIACRDLLGGCDLMSPEGQARFKAEKMLEKCRGYVETSVQLLEELTQNG